MFSMNGNPHGGGLWPNIRMKNGGRDCTNTKGGGWVKVQHKPLNNSKDPIAVLRRIRLSWLEVRSQLNPGIFSSRKVQRNPRFQGWGNSHVGRGQGNYKGRENWVATTGQDSIFRRRNTNPSSTTTSWRPSRSHDLSSRCLDKRWLPAAKLCTGEQTMDSLF